jgi:ectoine hydroxylase-related dioxygenase (phytanoyl-CoA dioxygenase family)
MTLSSSQYTAMFERDGYILVPHVFSREQVAEFKQEIKRVLDAARQEAIDAGRPAHRVGHHGVFVGLAARSPLFREAIADERLANLLEAVIGPNVEFLSDKVVFKNHDEDFGTPWHQDWSYWYGSHKVSVWIPLDDVTPENGCLRLVPGSHRAAINHNGKVEDDHGFNHRIDADQIPADTVVTAPLEAGGALIFHDLTLHASHDNTSGKERWVWIPTYRDARAEDPDYEWATAARIVRGSKTD